MAFSSKHMPRLGEQRQDSQPDALAACLRDTLTFFQASIFCVYSDKWKVQWIP